MVATTPAPTVRPPSRMAKRSFSSMAIGTISSTSIVTLSPGITISVPSGSVHDAGHVRRAEVELRTVVGEERRVTAALFLGQDVGLGLELRVRLHRARLAQHLAALDVLALRAAQQAPTLSPASPWSSSLRNISTPVTVVFVVGLQADDLDFLADLDDAALDAARHHRAAARDREHVLDRHQERLVHRTLRLRDVGVDRLHQLQDRVLADLRVACPRARTAPNP